MIEGERSGRPGSPWKLWHLAAAVLASALVLGGLRALKQAGSGLFDIQVLAGPPLILASGYMAVRTFRAGWRGLFPHLDPLWAWGFRVGGLAGLGAVCLANLGVLALLAGSAGVGLSVAWGLWWLIDRSGAL